MQSEIPFPVILAVLIIAALLEAAVIGMAIYIGVLPIMYLILVIVIFLAIDVGLYSLIANRKMKKKRFYTGMILTVLLMILLLPMGYFLYSTGDALQKISSMRDQFEEYDVIALKDSSYESLDDIKGKTVYALGSQSKMNVEAREKLITAADVEYSDATDIMALGNRLVDDQGNLHDDLILVSQSYYDMQCEEIEGFKKNTKKIYSMDVMKRSSNSSRKINPTKDPFNVYITGIDAWGSIDKVSRSDVNMIVTINPQTRQILMTSIPRDCYIPLHSFGEMDKLTHSGIYGVDETLETVQDWLDVDMDYYVKLNFTMVVLLINEIDGIDVYSDKAFKSSVSGFTYEKGMNHMRGKKALFFARERKSFEKGDAERIKNQQKVLKALIRKVTSSRVILTSYPDILEVVSDNMTTNISRREMAALARMQLRDMDTKWNIQMTQVKCDEANRGTYSMGMGRELFVNIPKEESVEKVKQQIHDVMYPAQEKENPMDLLKK